jgi:drug/metabolite transporter (DMT)-like permease
MVRGASEESVKGGLLVLAAVLIMAAANPIVRLMAEAGSGRDGPNPITPCNVLLIGSFCAFLVLLAIHGRSWKPEAVRALSSRDWAGMVAGAVLSSALAPAFTLLALESTSATNVVLVGRIEPLLVLVLAGLVLGEAISRFALAGTVVSLLGVALAFLLERGGEPLRLGEGELYGALAAMCFAAATILSRRAVRRVPLGIFVTFRMWLAVVVFFITACWLYGPQHFTGVTSPFLWQAMALYGGVFMAGAQLCWFAGLRWARTADVSLTGAFSPVAGIVFALVLLGEPPSPALAAGGGVILAGIAIGLLGQSTLEQLRGWRRGLTGASLAPRLAPA